MTRIVDVTLHFEQTVRVMIADDCDPIIRITGPEGDDWRRKFYDLHSQDDVFLMFADNAVRNGCRDARWLDGWADLAAGEVTMEVVDEQPRMMEQVTVYELKRRKGGDSSMPDTRRPLSPEMVRALRWIGGNTSPWWAPTSTELRLRAEIGIQTVRALWRRKLILPTDDVFFWRRRWRLTDAGKARLLEIEGAPDA